MQPVTRKRPAAFAGKEQEMRLTYLVVAGALALAVPAAARAVNVHVYFVYGEHGVAVHRPAPSTTPARAAVRSLLAGPTAAERRHGFTSAVPAGTRLLGLTLGNHVATVDLSSRFAAGGGSAAMNARLAQLVYTLTTIRGVNAVQLRLEGRIVRVFSGEGLILRQPLTRGRYADFVP